MAKKKKESENGGLYLTQSEIFSLSQKHAEIEQLLLKKEISRLRGVVQQFQMQEQLRKLQESVNSHDKNITSKKEALEVFCKNLGEKYGVDFSRVVYDDLTGEIKGI